MRNKLRAALTMLGIVIGVAAVIAAAAAGTGVQQQVLQRFESLGANVLTISPGVQNFRGGRGAAAPKAFTDADTETLRQLATSLVALAPDNIRDAHCGNVTIRAKAKHSMSAFIPVSQLQNVATAVEGIFDIQEPIRPYINSITGEGVALMNADDWQSYSYDGTGVKVGIIDLGFNGMTAARTNGDMTTYVGYDYTGTGLQTGTEHGTAVAEAIYDIAPQADFYLFKIAELADFENAKDQCITSGIHVINHSVGWVNTGGYYNGTGGVCDVASDAISNGLVWVNAAGNYAEKHYRATFVNNGDGYHNFGGGATINFLGPDSAHVWLHDPDEVIRVFLNWNNYPTTNRDYDLWLMQYDGFIWREVASSERRQDGTIPPEEDITYTNTVDGGRYGVVVVKYSATTNVNFTLISAGRSFGRRTNANSILDPATVTNVVTVGAIDRNDYDSGPQETFSSQGPTTDGRTKPDIASPDNCNSYTYGYWTGTSLASPHVAGICALIKSRFAAYTNTQIRNYLYTNCTVDLGAAGKDNIYGWGKVVLPDVAYIYVSSPNGGESWQAGSSHAITWLSNETSGNVKIEYSTNSGSSWTTIIASTADDGTHILDNTQRTIHYLSSENIGCRWNSHRPK